MSDFTEQAPPAATTWTDASDPNATTWKGALAELHRRYGKKRYGVGPYGQGEAASERHDFVEVS